MNSFLSKSESDVSWSLFLKLYFYFEHKKSWTLLQWRTYIRIGQAW